MQRSWFRSSLVSVPGIPRVASRWLIRLSFVGVLLATCSGACHLGCFVLNFYNWTPAFGAGNQVHFEQTTATAYAYYAFGTPSGSFTTPGTSTRFSVDNYAICGMGDQYGEDNSAGTITRLDNGTGVTIYTLCEVY
jgi:hypothetical protein